MVLPQNSVNYSNKNNGGKRKTRVEQGILKGRLKKKRIKKQPGKSANKINNMQIFNKAAKSISREP